ncbi:hypothetical protein [Phascolarctobacterium sp.]
MFYVLNLGSTSTTIVGLYKVKGSFQIADVFKVNSGYSDFVNKTVSDQLIQNIPDYTFHEYFVVCDAFYKCGTATVDETVNTSNNGDLDELKITNICDDLLPVGLKKNEYLGTIMRRFPKTERQDFVSTAYLKKELYEGIKEYFADKGAEVFAIYPEAYVFTELLAAAGNKGEYILKLGEGKFVYSAPKGIVVCQNKAYSDEDAASFLYSFANDLFETDPNLQLPKILLADKLDLISNANIANRYIPAEALKKEICASLGACAAWSGRPQGRKPAPPGEASDVNTGKRQEEGDKNGLLEKIRQFFTKAGH